MIAQVLAGIRSDPSQMRFKLANRRAVRILASKIKRKQKVDGHNIKRDGKVMVISKSCAYAAPVMIGTSP